MECLAKSGPRARVDDMYSSLPTRSVRGTSSVRSRRLPTPRGGGGRRRRRERDVVIGQRPNTKRSPFPRKDTNATRRRFDALEEEEENDFHAPPGLSHAAVREDGDGDSVDDFSDDDEDDDDGSILLSPLPTVRWKRILGNTVRSNSERFDPPVYDLDVWIFTLVRGLAVLTNHVRGKCRTLRHREGLRGDTTPVAGFKTIH